MGLILCENRKVNNPLYFPSLGKRLYSLEELCYVIYNYPLYVIHNFVNQRLFSFLEYELKLGLNALIVEKWAKDSSYDADVLISVLNYSDYYSATEIEAYKKTINELHSLPAFELFDRMGLAYFADGLYGKALDCFKISLKNAEGLSIENERLLLIKAHEAAAYANMFEFYNAFEVYRDILETKEDPEILKKIYFLSKLDNVISNKEEYIAYLGSRIDNRWDALFQDMKNESAQCDASKRLLEQMQVDSHKRRSLLDEKVSNIKSEYRNMI